MIARQLSPRSLAASLIVVVLVGCTSPIQGGQEQRSDENAIIVDNKDPVVELEGPWQSAQKGCAYRGECVWAPLWDNPPDGIIDPEEAARVTFRPALPEPGLYEVYAWWCRAPGQALASRQRIWICASRGYSCVPVFIDPQQNEGQWNSLGTFYLETDADLTIKNSAREFGAPPGAETVTDGAVVADAFRFIYRGPRPETLTPIPFAPQPSPTAPGAD